jgi:hypothetical protein
MRVRSTVPSRRRLGDALLDHQLYGGRPSRLLKKVGRGLAG